MSPASAGLIYLSLFGTPDEVHAPRGGGAVIHNTAIEQHGFELCDGNAVDRHIVLFGVAFGGALCEAFSEEDGV